MVGKRQPHIVTYRKGAEVLEHIKPIDQSIGFNPLLDKAEVSGNCQVDLTLLLDKAEVFEKIKVNINVCLLLDKAQHLSVIHTLPKECWLFPNELKAIAA